MGWKLLCAHITGLKGIKLVERPSVGKRGTKSFVILLLLLSVDIDLRIIDPKYLSSTSLIEVALVLIPIRTRDITIGGGLVYPRCAGILRRHCFCRNGDTHLRSGKQIAKELVQL